MTQIAPRPAARRRSAALAAAVLGTALVTLTSACSGSSTSAAHPSAPGATGPASAAPAAADGQRVSDPNDGVRFRLPSGWHQIPLGNSGARVLTSLVHDQQQQGEIVQQIRLGQMRGMRVFALRPRGTAKPDSLTLTINQATAASLASLQDQLKIASNQYAKSAPQFSTIKVPTGQALRVHYLLDDGDSSTQYYVLANTLAYVLTVTTSPTGGATPDQAVGDAVVRTLQLSPAA